MDMSTSDVSFLKAMIVHHEAAITMSRRYLADTPPNTRQARVSDLARAIITAQTAEIADMRKWLPSHATPTASTEM